MITPAKVGLALAGWRGYAVAAAAAAVLAWTAAWTAQGWRADANTARVEAERLAEREAQTLAIIAAVEAAREEGRRRTAAVEKARDDATKQAAAAAAGAASARVELNGLRARADALARAAVGRNPAAADGSPAGAAAVDLLAYMFGRVSDRAEELASVADRARIAGLTCEKAYDGVRGAL